VVLRPDGRLALDCDPDCCGPTTCNSFFRMVPCYPLAPDPACQPPPEKGEIWVCSTLTCTGGSEAGPWSGVPGRGIYFDGLCWTRADLASVPRDQLPVGATVIEEGTVECITCGDPRCGAFYYATAVPCDPAYSGPPVLYCPAGLPFDCSVLNPSIYIPGTPNQCFEFSRSAPTQPYPNGTVPVVFPPGTYPLQTCCTCNTGCVRTARNFQDQCAGQYQLSCCCGDLTNAVVVYGGSNQFDGWTQGFGGPYRQSITIETWSGTSNATGQHRTVRTLYEEDGSVIGIDIDVTEDLPPFAPSCPLNVFPNYAFYQCEHPCPQIPGGTFTPPVLNHTCDRYDFSVAWNCAPNTGMIPGTRVTSSVFARLIGMVPTPGCRSDSCGGGFAFAQGSDNGGIGIRGTGSRVTDPAVAAWMRQSYGGCSGCGDSPNPV